MIMDPTHYRIIYVFFVIQSPKTISTVLSFGYPIHMHTQWSVHLFSVRSGEYADVRCL